MYTIKNDVITEQIINKSRFITNLILVLDETDAKSKLEVIRSKYHDATHNCYAYIIGKTANIAKFSDDGEPSGTAGVVIFDCLKKNNLTNVLAVITRYYGGIKLGAGGLVRAYSSSTSLGIDEAVKTEIIEYSKLSIKCDYNILGVIEKYISEYELISKEFTQNVTITISLPVNEITELFEKLIDVSKNQVELNIISN